MSVLVVGSVAYDSITTPFGTVKRTLGGSASYASLAAALFAPVSLVAVVGGDFQKEDVELLSAHRIDLEGLEIVQAGQTFHWEGCYEGDMAQARTLSTCVNVFEGFKPTLPPALREKKYVFLANVDPELQLCVLDQLTQPRLVVADTMNFWITGKPELVREVLRRVDVVMLNDAEAMLLTGTSNLVAAGRQLLQLGMKRVVIKKGAHGSIMLSPDGEFCIIPALPLEVIKDPTGAGDSFAGAFIGSLSGTRRLTRNQFRLAIALANVLASFVVEDFGVEGLVKLNRTSIDERLQLLRQFCIIPQGHLEQ